MKILFVTARYPYPLLSGDRVRAFYQLKTLAQDHEVFLLCPPPASSEADAALRDAVGHRVHLAPNRFKAAGRVATGAFRKTPLQTLAHADRSYRREALALIERFDIQLAHVQLVRMAPVLQGVRLPRMLDFVDALSENMRQMAERTKGPKKIAAVIESGRLKEYEQIMVREYDAGAITSIRDHKSIGSPQNMFVVPQGVPIHGGAPEEIERPPSRIIFTGKMSYFPNEDAVVWFATEVFPLVRQKVPEAEFSIAGADPGPKVKALSEIPGVKVLGFVNSISDELTASTVAVVPMRCGTGMQTKIVEAMSTGTPLVITSEGMGSLTFADGEHVLLANGAQAYADAVVRLLADKALWVKIARQGRLEVEQNYSWVASTKELVRGYEYAIETHDRKAVHK